MTSWVYKCRRCRCALLTDRSLLTSHEEPLTGAGESALTDCDRKSTVWYVSTEDSCPDWVTRCLNKGEWCKGKLLCPKCRGRLGSFDFTSSQRCHCGAEICPPIHINKNRVDCFSEKLDVGMKITDWEAENTEVEMTNRCGSGEARMAAVRVVSPYEPCAYVAADRAQSTERTQHCDGGTVRKLCSSKCNERPDVNSVGRDVSISGGNESRNCTHWPNLRENPSHNTQPDTNCDQSACNLAKSQEKAVDQVDQLWMHSPSTGVGKEAHSQRFSSKRRPRHKRVASDCSWLRDKQCLDFATTTTTPPPNNLPRSTNSCDNLNSISVGAEDGQSRQHGNRSVPISTSLLGKRYGHRRAQSMTVTSNRFEFLQEDVESQGFSRSPQSGPDNRKHHMDRPVAMETADPPVPEEYVCPVCLDLFCYPHSCLPCRHSFCESCLRQLARSQPEKTACPMCRQVIVQCQPQHSLSFLLKTNYPNHYNRRRKALKKQHGKLHPLPKLKADLRHKLGVVMQNRLRGRRLREICRDHFIMTFFVYTGAVALLLGVFLLLILICCKSLFFLFLLLQWLAVTAVRCATGAADLAVMVSPTLIATPTDAVAANRVILSVVALATVYKLWIGLWSRDRGAGRT
ncbi:uncharacterized protein LOC135463079 [Liolophura sinensis]|uniref:uncharacterized protein LOC135463079 n=1 Tax=Liolophura sinensis TaxID=3198878 RepID=UPI003157F823